MIGVSLFVFWRQVVWFQILVFVWVGGFSFASICIANISPILSLPGFPGVAWRGVLPSTPPELIDRAFGDSCAQQQSIVPGGLFQEVEAIRERRALMEVCRDWRPPWVNGWEPYRHPPGWPEFYIDRKLVLPQPTDKAKPLQWEVDRVEQVAVALRQHLQGVREDTGAVAAKSEVKWEQEKIFSGFSGTVGKRVGRIFGSRRNARTLHSKCICC